CWTACGDDTATAALAAAADPKAILHCALTSAQRLSKLASSSATTVDDRRPMDLKKSCRFGRTLTKSSLFTACEPCGPAKTNDSAYCAAMVAGSEPRMFDSYVSKNALTRSLACGTAASLSHCGVPRHECIMPAAVDAIRAGVI